jgi:hypothetical protein
LRAGRFRPARWERMRAGLFTVAIGGGTFERVEILVHALDG